MKNYNPYLRKRINCLRVVTLALMLITANNIYAQTNETLKETTSPQEPQRIENKEDKVFEFVEKMPEFPGGTKEMMIFIAENLRYPKEFATGSIGGRVITNFIVNNDGSISNIEVIRCIDPLLDAEAVRVISTMPNWNPGLQLGEPLNVRFTLPIIFRLEMYDDANIQSIDSLKVESSNEVSDEKDNKENTLFIKYLSDNIRYPVRAQEKGIGGIIRATFDVSSDGEVSNIQITEGRVRWLKNEILELIKKMPNEIALLRTGGKEVKGVEFSVSFQIQNEITRGSSFDSEEKTDIKVVAVRMY